jgi:type 1 glutamine amidotransferase
MNRLVVIAVLLSFGAAQAPRNTISCERAQRVSHASGAGQGGPASERVGESEGQSPSEERIELLFLGHNIRHHDSGRYAPMLKEAVARDGINLTYTTDPNDLNAEKLAAFDALMIYANHTRITPEQEKALLDYVAGGKGFLPIHSASFCFQNSPDYIALVGAQFQRHGTGEFTAEIVKPDHPTLNGITPFQVWDETYVHTKHNTDRVVLMERVDADGREPWTWVRTHGRGRVFYTAYGHDERAWGHPSFQRLLRNAIVWVTVGAVREPPGRGAVHEPPLQELHGH